MTTLPNFILGGAFPCGTGHLFTLLAQHPDVYLPLPMAPETNFFVKTRDYEQGLPAYSERWFSKVAGQRAVGERSSLLLCSEQAPARVAEHLPGVKLVFLFRDPVDRAYAGYRFTALAGHEELSFEDALAAEDSRLAAITEQFWREIRPHAYFERGLYATQLSRWLEVFPKDQLHMLRSDELISKQDASLAELFEFLGVDASFRPTDEQRHFSSFSVRDLSVQCALRKEFGGELDGAIQRHRDGLPADGVLDERLRANMLEGKQPADASVLNALRARYRESNLKLQSMVPFAIDDWLGA